MKSKFNFFLWLTAIALLAFQSCREKEDPTILEISAEKVSFTKAGGEESVTITTNRENWVATSPLELTWVTLAQNGSRLSINAKANTEGLERSGYILVNSGDVAAKIVITQGAGDDILTLSFETVNFPKKGGEKRIDVISNKKFVVTVDAGSNTWLRTTYMEGAGYLTVSADSYSQTGSRVGKVYLTAGSTVKEISVNQKGHSLVVLPLIAWKTNVREVTMFEEERGSVLTQLPGFLISTFTFATDNNDFPTITYSFSSSGNYLNASAATKNKELLKGAIFEQFMVDEGFEKVENLRYLHREFPYEVKIVEQSDGSIIQTAYYPKQDRAYPTFTELPLLTQMGWTSLPPASVRGQSIDYVKNAENGFGSIPNAELTNEAINLFWFDPSQSDQNEKGFVARAYLFYTTNDIAGPIDASYVGLLRIARALNNQINLAWWYDDATSMYYLTREFKQLLTAGGFVFMLANKGYEYYARNNNGVLDVFATRTVSFIDFREGEKLNDIQVFKSAANESTVSILINQEKFIRFAREMDSMLSKIDERTALKRIGR